MSFDLLRSLKADDSRRLAPRVVWLPGVDSNHQSQNQNLLCYRLHHRVSIRLILNDAGRDARPFAQREGGRVA